MYENPSAGKFEPPQPPRETTPEPWIGSWIAGALLILAIWGGLDRLQQGSSWLAAAAALAGLGLAIVEFACHRRRADERGEGPPYTPPTHLTR